MSAGAQTGDRCLEGTRGAVKHEGTGGAVVVDELTQLVDVHFPAIMRFGVGVGLVNTQDRTRPRQEEATWEQRRAHDDVVVGGEGVVGEPIEVMFCRNVGNTVFMIQQKWFQKDLL